MGHGITMEKALKVIPSMKYGVVII